MSKDERTQIKQLLDDWLEYGDLKELAEKHLKPRYPRAAQQTIQQMASKIKNQRLHNSTFLNILIERAIYRKNLFQSATQRLTA